MLGTLVLKPNAGSPEGKPKVVNAGPRFASSLCNSPSGSRVADMDVDKKDALRFYPNPDVRWFS